MSEVTQEEHWFKENGDTTKLPNRKLSYIQRRALFLQGAKTILGVVSGSWFVSSCTQQKQNLNSLSPSPALSNVKVFRILKGHVEPVLSVAWSPDSTRLVSGGFDYTVKQWDVDTGKVLVNFTDHTDWVFSVAWSPDGTRIASASADKTIKIWNAVTGKLLVTCLGHTRPVNSVDWSPDGEYIVSGSSRPDATVRIWNVKTGESVHTYQCDAPSHRRYNVHATVWSPYSRQIASGTDRNYVYIQDIDTNTPALIYKGHGEQINTVAWAPKVLGKHYIVSGSGGYEPYATPPVTAYGEFSVQVWNASTGETVFIYKGHTASISSVTWSPDGKYIASASMDRTVHVWEAATGCRIAKYSGHASDVDAVAWSPNGNYIASTGADTTIHIWQIDTTSTPC